MNGRIGVAKRIHVIEKLLPQEGYNWATSLCGWAGTCVETDEEPTCFRCQMASRDLARQKEAQKKEGEP